MLATSMAYVVPIYMDIVFYVQRIAHLTCAAHVAFVLCVVAVLSTWQRSRRARRREIQGRQHDTALYVMSDNYSDSSCLGVAWNLASKTFSTSWTP